MGDENGIVLVPFSGGLDSTYMIYRLLQEGRKICPVYFELKNNYQDPTKPQIEADKVNRSKAFTEKQQATKIVSMLMEEFNGSISRISVIPIPYLNAQWESWVYGVQWIASRNLFFSQVAFEWNQSDIDDEEGLNKFRMRATNFNEQVGVEAIFPVFHLNKIQISTFLPIKYLNEIFFCELPLYEKDNEKYTSRPCGKCKACKLQKILKIFKNKKYQLEPQPSDQQVGVYNEDHEYYLPIYGEHYVNGVKPMHLKKKATYKLELTN